jgi:hypothetical protein
MSPPSKSAIKTNQDQYDLTFNSSTDSVKAGEMLRHLREELKGRDENFL